MPLQTQEILQSKLAEIDAETARRKAAAEFICTVMQENETALRAVFIPEGFPEEDVPAELYRETEKSLGWIERESISNIGVTLMRKVIGDSSNATPLERLGWAECRPMNLGDESIPQDRPYTHVYGPSAKGREIVNRLRSVQGYVTLEEQRRINSERHEAELARAGY
jgi:hypothetical protein